MTPQIIPTIFTATDQYSRPVVRMTGVTNSLNGSLRTASVSAMELAANAALIGGAILVPLGLATKEAVAFEKQMGNVATIVDTTKESIADMGTAVLDIASRTPVAIHDLTESLYIVRSAGVSAADAMKVLETSAQLSVAGLSTTEEATKAVTSALVAFKGQGLSVDQIANSFFLTVKEGKTKMDALNESFGANAGFVASLGVKLQDFNALTAALTITGQSASEAQNGITAALVGLEKPTTEMIGIYNKLGVASGRALLEKTGNVGDAIMAVSNAAKQANIEIPKLFNRNALKTVSHIEGGANEYYKKNLKEQGDQMQSVTALTEAYQKQLGTTAAQSQIAKNNLQTLGIRIGELLLPALTALVKIVSAITRPLARFAERHKLLSRVIVYSIAVIGLLVLSIAAVSGAIWTVNKAMVIWEGLSVALKFAQGALAVANGTVTGSMLANATAAVGVETAYKGATFATQAWTAATNTLLGRLLIVAALVYFLQKAWEKYYKQRQRQSSEEVNSIADKLPAGQRDQFYKDYTTPANKASMKSIFSLSEEKAKTYDSLKKAIYEPQRDSLNNTEKNDYAPDYDFGGGFKLPNIDTVVNVYVDKDGKFKGQNTKTTFGNTVSVSDTYNDQ